MSGAFGAFGRPGAGALVRASRCRRSDSETRGGGDGDGLGTLMVINRGEVRESSVIEDPGVRC
jgi:hypothetical protein